MERNEHEPHPSRSVEQVLNSIPMETMLECHPYSYRIYEYLETGEQAIRSFQAGEEQFDIEFPITQPFLVREEKTLEAVVPYKESVGFMYRGFESPEIEALSLPALKQAARRSLEARVNIPGEDTIACLNCKGAGKGKTSCPYCEGSGLTALYPIIELQNELTQHRTSIQLDVAKFLLMDSAIVDAKNGTLSIENAVHEAMQAIGVDVSSVVRIVNGQTRDIEMDKFLVSLDHRRVRSTQKQVQPLITDEMLETAQRSFARAFAWPYGKLKDEDGVTRTEQWVLRPVRTIEEAFHDLKTATAARGGYLGYCLAPVATGQSGPSFYILDGNGKAIQYLSAEYTMREAIENAWLALNTAADA